MNKVRREDAGERQELAEQREQRLLKLRQKRRREQNSGNSENCNLVESKKRKIDVILTEKESARVSAIIAQKYRKPKRLQGGLPRDVNFQYSVIRAYNKPRGR